MNIFDFYLFLIKQNKSYIRYGMDLCKYHEYKNILKNLKFKNNENILDIGCSDSYLPLYLVTHNKINFHLADIDEKVLKIQKQRFAYLKATICKEDISHLSFQDNYFDWIFAIQIFSLLPSDLDILGIKELYRIIKKNGKVFITIFHNKNYVSYENSSSDNYWGLKHRLYNLPSIKERFLDTTGFKIKNLIFWGDKKTSKFVNFWYAHIPKNFWVGHNQFFLKFLKE